MHEGAQSRPASGRKFTSFLFSEGLRGMSGQYAPGNAGGKSEAAWAADREPLARQR